MLVSDTVSISHLSPSKPEFTEDSLIHHVHFVLANFPISETCLKQFQLETKNAFYKLWSLTQSMNGQKSTSYPHMYLCIISTTMILHYVKVFF